VIGIAVVSILLGLVLLAGAWRAFELEEPEVGALTGSIGTMFLLLGAKTWMAA